MRWVNLIPGKTTLKKCSLVRVKQKLSFRGHVYLEAFLSEAVQLELVYLKQNNLFLHDIRIEN